MFCASAEEPTCDTREGLKRASRVWVMRNLPRACARESSSERHACIHFYETIVPTASSMTIRDPKGTHWASYMTGQETLLAQHYPVQVPTNITS